MKLTLEAIKEINLSNLTKRFKEELIKCNGETEEETYVGKYKGFFLFQSDIDEQSFALNSNFYKKNEFNINSFNGIEEVKFYIREFYV